MSKYFQGGVKLAPTLDSIDHNSRKLHDNDGNIKNSNNNNINNSTNSNNSNNIENNKIEINKDLEINSFENQLIKFSSIVSSSEIKINQINNELNERLQIQQIIINKLSKECESKDKDLIYLKSENQKKSIFIETLLEHKEEHQKKLKDELKYKDHQLKEQIAKNENYLSEIQSLKHLIISKELEYKKELIPLNNINSNTIHPMTNNNNNNNNNRNNIEAQHSSSTKSLFNIHNEELLQFNGSFGKEASNEDLGFSLSTFNFKNSDIYGYDDVITLDPLSFQSLDSSIKPNKGNINDEPKPLTNVVYVKNISPLKHFLNDSGKINIPLLYNHFITFGDCKILVDKDGSIFKILHETIKGELLCNVTRIVLSVTVIKMKQQYHWNDSFKGVLLAAFAMGYLCTQLPAQALCDRFGGKKVFLVGLTTSVCTLFLVPVTAKHNALLILVRVACGIFQGVAYSTINWMVARWIPLSQRSTSASIIWSGIFIGTVVGDFSTPVILDYFSWEMSFYIIGGCCLLWSLLWLVFMSDYPKDIIIGIHPNELLFINHGKEEFTKDIDMDEIKGNNQKIEIQNENTSSRDLDNSLNSFTNSKDESIDSEVDYISSSSNSISQSKDSMDPPTLKKEKDSYFFIIRTFLTSQSVITLLYLNITCNWGYFLLLNWYPTYLSKQLGYSTGFIFACFNSLPFFIAFLNSIVFGYVSDKLESRGYKKNTIRKVLGSFVYWLPALFLMLLARVHVDNVGKIAFITIAICANGFSNVGYQMITLDISTVKNASIAMGIGNLGSAIPSMLGPLVGGYILDAFNGDWSYIFIISGTTYIVGTIVWVALMKTDVII
ncbi:hypothetical protein DICPUDRAFT_150878 [Dictyostelium purpureum]|uniref:Major facilitator superfamily (MFS) profile domain-containing protein n=1 Tax=Dictyostelium purpureum TaxID=5786 RepID=F0ZHH2_DICPU|nr:uncharacterized protein DICPUDRAFT_150878 [Dictyostelium purpureum]EGC36630.1 hypothetical protein DICPUDRAFT_150878 [Dictyostelium purpureum]|eukprot:XP_003286868.1 hypothetical protein DICPUDRAFT_150878 [Dictyostelium purpureum]